MLQVSALWPSVRHLPNSASKRIALTGRVAAQATNQLITALGWVWYPVLLALFAVSDQGYQRLIEKGTGTLYWSSQTQYFPCLQFDTPEAHATMEALGEAAGFTTVKLVKESQNELACVVLFEV
jgi:hypothetical protein